MKPMSPSVSFRLLPLLMAILPLALFGQDFFTTFHPDSIGMTTGQATRYAALQDTAISKSVSIVETALFQFTQQSDTISFQLPGSSDTLIAEASMVTEDSISGYIWAGRLINHLGYVSFVNRLGMVAGFIQAGSSFYELMPLDTVYQFLVERNNGSLKGCGMPAVEPLDTLGGGGGSIPDQCDFDGIALFETCPAVASVLLVLSQGGKDWVLTSFGSIETYVAMCQISVNLAFHNSDVPNKVIRIKWIERLDVDDLLSDILDFHVDRLKLPDLIGTDRDQYKADIAVLLTNQGYADVAGAVTEIGPVDDKAFAFVEAPYAISRFVFAHELGHLLGCRHNWNYDWGDDDTEVCAHAKRWTNYPASPVSEQIYEIDETWQTIVGVPLPSNAFFLVKTENVNFFADYTNAKDYRILHYSNPDVYYGGVSTGRDGGYIANNARFIRENACTVADFFETQELSVLITYAGHQPCLETKTFAAEIQTPETGIQGQAPYTILWYWSPKAFDHNNLGTYLDSGSSITLEEYPACPVFWLKCVVISSDGVTVNTIKKVVLGSVTCCTTDPESEEHGAVPNIAVGENLFPNPVFNGILCLEIKDLSGNSLDYSITDLNGRILSSGSNAVDATGRLWVNAKTLHPGLYILRLFPISGRPENFKFIIAQN